MKTRFEVEFFDFQVDPSTVQWHEEGFLKGPTVEYVEYPTHSAKTKTWRKSTATKAQSLQFTFTHKEKVHGGGSKRS